MPWLLANVIWAHATLSLPESAKALTQRITQAISWDFPLERQYRLGQSDKYRHLNQIEGHIRIRVSCAHID